MQAVVVDWMKPSGARVECVGGIGESLEKSFRDQT